MNYEYLKEINSELNKENIDKILQIKEYAKQNNIPIILDDGIELLSKEIKKYKTINILEIGAAIGYSSILMSLIDDKIKITTIEKNEERYNEAVKNIDYMNKKSNIEILYMDALEYKTNKEYDLIFIDASKGNNINFFNLFSKNLKLGGIIVTDNMLFHGLVEDESLIETKNQRKIVEKILIYKEFLDSNEKYETKHYKLGDGISVSKKVVK